MSVVDVVVGKLARFNANDRSDIDAMIDRDLIGHDELVSSFGEAVEFDLGVPSLPGSVAPWPKAWPKEPGGWLASRPSPPVTAPEAPAPRTYG